MVISGIKVFCAKEMLRRLNKIVENDSSNVGKVLGVVDLSVATSASKETSAVAFIKVDSLDSDLVVVVVDVVVVVVNISESDLLVTDVVGSCGLLSGLKSNKVLFKLSNRICENDISVSLAADLNVISVSSGLGWVVKSIMKNGENFDASVVGIKFGK